ncbi:MAG: IclR family transcriptional regulator [Alphaproteobacteria bacterium]|nr:IclR family transcriptional regulator [Alphaproteobacteria bacterium]
MKEASKPHRIAGVLGEIARSAAPLTANEIAERTRLPKATAYRLCDQLLAAGLIRRQIAGRGFVPGKALIDLSASVLSGRAIYTARHAVLQSVARELGETCNLSVPEAAGMVYWDRVECEWPLRLQLPVGTCVPFHATSAGKLFLSSLDKEHRQRLISELHLRAYTDNTFTDAEALNKDVELIQRRGYSLDNEEFIVGMCAVAVPVKDRDGRMMAALAVHAPRVRMPIAKARRNVPVMLAAAARLSQGLPERDAVKQNRA